jgi:transcriptional regulator with XRE-family HTH domain
MPAAKQRAAAALREAREARGLSLRQVCPHVNLSAGALSEIERGMMWETSTVRRVAAFYAPADTSAAA